MCLCVCVIFPAVPSCLSCKRDLKCNDITWLNKAYKTKNKCALPAACLHISCTRQALSSVFQPCPARLIHSKGADHSLLIQSTSTLTWGVDVGRMQSGELRFYLPSGEVCLKISSKSGVSLQDWIYVNIQIQLILKKLYNTSRKVWEMFAEA